MHIYEKHLDVFQDKLNNYSFGVVKHVNANQLDRTEDFYIYKTQADTKGLNRYNKYQRAINQRRASSCLLFIIA